jgi:NitT/TauT family transport system substrate-binding protein
MNNYQLRVLCSGRLKRCRDILLLSFLALAPGAQAAQLETINLSYSAAVVSGAPFWLGHDLKLFEREGLRSQLVYINAGPRVMAAILAGEVQLSLSGVNAIVAAFAQGGDPVALAGAVNTINVSVYARPEIRTPDDLRGKRLGITRFGGLTDVAVQYALKQWGLTPGKDVAIIQIGDASSLLGALVGNVVQAAGLQAPFTIRAAQLGHRELIDLSKSGLQYQNTVVVSTRSLVKRSPDTVRRFMRAYSTAMSIFHTQREATVKVMSKYLKGLDPAILQKSYEAFRAWMPEIPYLNLAGMETAVHLTPLGGKEKEIKASDLIDESFVRELDQQGFYRALYKK